MPRPCHLPAPYETGAFAVRTAKGEDVPMSSMRGLANPFRGVRSHEEPTSIDDRFAALGLARPGLILSHCSAALVHRLPVPRACEHVALHVATGGAKVRRPGVVPHRGARTPVIVRGVAVTSLADTWIDLAPCLALDDLVVLGDAVARRLRSIEPLTAVVRRRVPGVLRAREALTWVRMGSASPMETRSRVLVGRAGLPEPELNVAVHDPDGGWIAESDLVWREAKVLGEYQGEHHFGDYARGDKDIVRRRAVEAAGWTHVDFTKDDYFRRPRRLALVRRFAEALGCELSPEAVAEIGVSPGLPGGPLRPCGG